MTPKAGLERINLDPKKVDKILVCQLRQIGDVLLATPSIRLLKKAFPESEIHILTEKKSAPILEHNPDLAKIWAIDKKRLNHLGKELVFYFQVARQRFDLLVDFQQLPR
ncbi:MAG: glycosyltransferase family 9 protein, partial [Thermodesulfobacteriota bacterium]|nr:glycosyltransferase family 9 protein [Thermodesulfobacteriota bacterium]